jgi:hypothetical protein
MKSRKDKKTEGSFKRYDQIWDGEWTAWDWKNNQHRCCDCGAVHHLDFRVRDKKPETKFTIDKTLTYATRRRLGVKIVKTK